VAEVEREAGRLRLRTRTGAVLAADTVLSAVGLRPRTALAAGAGLAVQRGIVVDAFGASSDPDVFALGDCAQYEAGVMPYVMPIMAAARSIAATLLGSPEPIRFGTMPIAVKTPALPIAVVPAPASGDGTWRDAADATGVRMRYEASDGTLRGFVVAGECYGERQALARALESAPRAAAEPA
jgi:rubredoxin-NAD+ reductase